MRESVLNKIVVCPVCHVSYVHVWDICACPEEPIIKDWEDGYSKQDTGERYSG